MKYFSRNCNICDSDNFEVLSKKEYNSITKKAIFTFDVVEGICKNCGFVYQNPTPDETNLLQYYKNKFLHNSGNPDYDLKKRINYLKKIKDNFTSLLEIGSGNGLFLQTASSLGLNVKGMEPNTAAQSLKFTSNEIDNKETYDIVIINHVLEHVLNPLSFLKSLHSHVQRHGIILVEVPNLNLKEEYASAISHEHLSHFSPVNLSYLMKKAGFLPIELEFENVSRPIGFSILAKPHTDVNLDPYPKEYEKNIELYNAAFLTVQKNEINAKRIFENALKGEKKIALWGANYIMLKLLRMMPESFHRIVIVDNDSSRWNTKLSEDIPVTISNPEEIRNDKQIEQVIICAYSFEKDIRISLSNMGFSLENVKTVML